MLVVGTVFMTMDIPSINQRLGITRRIHPGLTDSISAVTSGIRRYWVVTTIFGLIVALVNGGIILAVGVSLPSCGSCSPSSPTTSPTSAS
ncbi:hypothetical protein G7085_17555 [Tessaracoccus sp. HDW20]|uniref:hypothetical protein n=1 Tax=Tessaracoccus coleopterorum TaxID=2714950 RepID=UPI0018D41F30|nr:hypothetical protein [Tessaracoccus coleopterorum]NHB85774.1 hypothetical protein [Tessaracoccus coleopterorum]